MPSESRNAMSLAVDFETDHELLPRMESPAYYALALQERFPQRSKP